jgi:hypothetical protein
MIDRIQIATIIDALIYGNAAAFSRAGAMELYNLLPAPARGIRAVLGSLMSFQARGTVQGGATQGVAAGAGGVSVSESDRAFDYDSRGRSVLRIGQWRVYRLYRSVEIEQVTADGDAGRAVLIQYRGGEPTGMRILSSVAFNLGGWSIIFARYRPWKVPV